MLKRIGLLVGAALGISLVAAPASASPPAVDHAPPATADEFDYQELTFQDAYYELIGSGGALGYGAMALLASSYTGIALTPSLIAHSFDE